MSSHDFTRSEGIRAALQMHVNQRLNNALSKINGTDTASDKKRQEQRNYFQLQALLENGTECVNQVQMATHIVKGIHPDIKIRHASNLNVNCSDLPDIPLLGSHVLADKAEIDATGNGTVNKRIFEVFLLLQTEYGRMAILDLLKEGDKAAVAALADTADQAEKIADALVLIDAARCERWASHTNAKQVYWPIGINPHDDGDFHLLAPLYPTSLVHRVYQTLQNDRFGDAAKAAREARKNGQWHEQPVREYQNLAIQNLGGSHPRNVSHLNHERRGDNYLLASLPPLWQSPDVKPLFGVDSLFKVFGGRRQVRQLVQQMRRFLEADPARNKATRVYRDELVEALLDELMQFTALVQTLEPGWTADAQCELPVVHCAWLDPDGTDAPPPDLIDNMAGDFARWLNARLLNPLPVGDAEYLQWRKQARELFKQEQREGAL